MYHQHLSLWLYRLISWGMGTLICIFGLISIPIITHGENNPLSEKITALKNSQNRWIEINLSSQRLIAWEGQNQVYAVVISTGKKSTPTRPGMFTIQSKLRRDRMRGADYDIPNVPYVMYYHRGYAIHGTFWHNQFGTPVSHGCTNLAVNHAQWLFNWTEVGTPLIIHY